MIWGNKSQWYSWTTHLLYVKHGLPLGSSRIVKKLVRLLRRRSRVVEESSLESFQAPNGFRPVGLSWFGK